MPRARVRLPRLPRTAGSAPQRLEAPKPCPPGSFGEGTERNPCRALGEERLLDVRFVGKGVKPHPEVTLVNVSDRRIGTATLEVYFYDGSGQELVPGNRLGCVMTRLRCRDVPLNEGLDRSKNTVVSLDPCFRTIRVPKDTAFLEAEALEARVEAPDKSPIYWSNPHLAPPDRPMRGAPSSAR